LTFCGENDILLKKQKGEKLMSKTQKIDLFFSKHRHLSQALFPALVSFLLTFSLLLVKQYLIFFILFCFMTLFLLLFVSVAPTRLSLQGIQELSKGNPYPLLNITEALLSFNLSESQKQATIINHCEGLRYTGKYKEAYEHLNELNIDKIPTAINTKIVYYANLSDLCSLLGKYDESIFYYKKVTTLFSDMKEGAVKRNIQNSYVLTFLDIQNRLITRRYDEVINLSALFLANQGPQKRVSAITDVSLACALAHFQKGEFSLAKNHLYGIIQNGRMLYAVTEAKNLLSTIESQENKQK